MEDKVTVGTMLSQLRRPKLVSKAMVYPKESKAVHISGPESRNAVKRQARQHEFEASTERLVSYAPHDAASDPARHKGYTKASSSSRDRKKTGRGTAMPGTRVGLVQGSGAWKDGKLVENFHR